MTIDPDIRDQAYQFFIEEASELLDIIEAGLLNLHQDASVQQVHEIMRAAHSIKGGAASVGLETIKIIAHRLEDSFKALYNDTVIVDKQLEALLIRGYDCLCYPLQLQIDTGAFNEEQTLALAEQVFSELEERLGPALDNADAFLPDAADLGIDIVTLIFEADVADVLSCLRNILAHPQDYDCSQELQIQLEILTGFAELVEWPDFTLLVDTAKMAAAQHWHQPIPVIRQMLQDVEKARAAVLEGHKEKLGKPSSQLLELADSLNDRSGVSAPGVSEPINMFELTDLDLAFPDESELSVFSEEDTTDQVSALEEIWSIDAVEFPSVEKIDSELGKTIKGSLGDSGEISSIDAETLSDIWGDAAVTSEDSENFSEIESEESPSADCIQSWVDYNSSSDALSDCHHSSENTALDSSETSRKKETDDFEATVELIENVYDTLPTLADEPTPSLALKEEKRQEQSPAAAYNSSSKLSAKVDLNRLEQMDQLVGELAINRNSLSLHDDQFQLTVSRLGQRFHSFCSIIKQLQTLSDQVLITSEKNRFQSLNTFREYAFDSLEMDSYGEINSLLEDVLEEVFQLAESIEDVTLFAGQSNQLLERQRRTLTQLRDELMWARMVSLNRVLKRFPRVIRELSTSYQKPVELKLIGTDVLVDRVMLEKLYDPLLHLLRNAFSHGIESVEERQRFGKPAKGTIEIRAYHRSNCTVIEISDDGRGLDFEKITQRAIATQLLSLEQVATLPRHRLQELIFEPGFSTAQEVSELSGRGVGLDIVRENVRSFNGKLSLTTKQNEGTTFYLRIPLTLTLTKLVVGSVGTTAIAINSDSIEEIFQPDKSQLKQSGDRCFLHWRDQLIPIYKMAQLLNYQCQVPEQLPQSLQSNKGQRNTVLILDSEQGKLALELEQIVTEQELVIKPMGEAIAAPSYINGCAVLADGGLVPVIDGTALVQFEAAGFSTTALSRPQRAQTILIIDDSSALRRTLTLTLRKAGYRVLQAKDGRDGLDQLQRGALPDLIICDVEMPRLNGFEFLSQRCANPAWADIPAVMLTSRGNHKHRTLARHLGATDYFTKPYLEKEFLGAIAALLQSP